MNAIFITGKYGLSFVTLNSIFMDFHAKAAENRPEKGGFVLKYVFSSVLAGGRQRVNVA